MGIIYKAENKVNGKVYIGKTIKSLEERKEKHYRNYREERPFKLYNAIKKYGWDNFEWSVIEDLKDNDFIDEREKYWISKYNSYKTGYNMTLGGDGAFGFKQSKEHKEKISKALIGNKNGYGRAKKVICLNNNMIFNSTKDAAEYFNTNGKHPYKQVWEVCAGKRKITNGLTFKYLEDYNG